MTCISTLNLYTHVVDTSHRKAVEDVERKLFGDLDPTGPKLDDAAEPEKAATLQIQLVRIGGAARI